MKTKRILSALLSATLVLSSLPLMASNGADNDTEAAENLLGSVTPTVADGSVSAKADADSTIGDYYLRISNRSNRDNYAYYNIGSAPAAGTYYISFDARMTTDGIGVKDSIKNSKEAKYLKLRVRNGSSSQNRNYWIPTNNCDPDVSKSAYTKTDLKNNGTYVLLEQDWKHYELEYINVAKGDALAFYAWGSTSNRYAQSFDIDNFKVWYVDGSGTHPVNGENGYTFESDNKENEHFTTASYYNVTFTRTEAENYQRAELSSGKDMTIVYTFGENGAGIEIEPGVYELDGDIRCGGFIADILSDYVASPAKDTFVYDSAVDVTVTVYVGEESYTLISNLKTDTAWKNIGDKAELMAIPESGLLKKIEIKAVNRSSNVVDKNNPVTNPNLPVDIKNMSLIRKDDSTTELDKADDNLLSGVTVSSQGNITVSDPYLYVPERPTSVADFVTFTIAEKVLAKTYYVSFDARLSADSKNNATLIRLQIPSKDGIKIEEAQPNGWPASGKTDVAMNEQYVVPLLGENFTMNFPGWSVAADGKYFPLFKLEKGNEWVHFEGQFTPIEAANKSLRLTINKGNGTFVEPIDVANFKVWNDAGVIYSSDFRDGVDETVKGNSVVPSVVPSIMSVAAVPGLNTEAKYDTSAINARSGIYTFRADVSGTANAVVEFVLSDGQVITSDSFALSADKNTAVSASVEIESGVSITSISIKADASAALNISGAGLTYRESDDGNDIPNIGIIMVLLLKKQGGANEEVKPEVEPEVKPEAESNLIANGDFAAAPEIVKEGLDTTKTAWFANAGEDYHYDANGAALKDQPKYYHDHNVAWNEDGYVTVTGREFNLRKVYFSTGLTLEPGDYMLSVDCKTANSGEKSNIRIAADKLFNAAAADAFNISNEWFTKTIEFTVTEATPLTLGFYGGPNASFIHDFCVDNVVLIKK